MNQKTPSDPTAMRLLDLVPLIEKAMPLTKERLDLTKSLNSLALKVSAIDTQLIPFVESNIMMAVIEDDGKRRAAMVSDLVDAKEAVVEFSEDLLTAHRAKAASNPTKAEKAYLHRNFVTETGRISGTFTLSIADFESVEHSVMLDRLVAIGLIEVGVYGDTIKATLTKNGYYPLQGSWGRITRIGRKLMHSTYAKTVAFISGILTAMIASEVEKLVTNVLPMLP